MFSEDIHYLLREYCHQIPRFENVSIFSNVEKFANHGLTPATVKLHQEILNLNHKLPEH